MPGVNEAQRVDGGASKLMAVPRFPTVPHSPNRLMKNGECRGAKPLCRESEGVPQIQISSLSSLERAPEEWSKEFFSALLRDWYTLPVRDQVASE